MANVLPCFFYQKRFFSLNFWAKFLYFVKFQAGLNKIPSIFIFDLLSRNLKNKIKSDQEKYCFLLCETYLNSHFSINSAKPVKSYFFKSNLQKMADLWTPKNRKKITEKKGKKRLLYFEMERKTRGRCGLFARFKWPKVYFFCQYVFFVALLTTDIIIFV